MDEHFGSENITVKNVLQHRVKKIAGKSLLTKILTDFLGSCFIY
jgi:hypothetical protein